ncbi:recombination protein RecO [Nitratifractor salsuginis]|uniref:Recombination protein RecO n=1 Tax=Nitratifractor salsuginis (strain DSM 16511 / JCM 12458 / E9I37-1) TaxID=749222 RepID=E6WZR0_NITSE|nr:recombination protein RecO [Nitratifractor salsuginis]ADV46701.1 putative recombination protein RecO [Nitratifractor salsuginis DSM 16511]
MKGFIVSLRPARDEDLIVTLLEEHALRSYYRFYGARHSILQLGYLIDYESEEESRYMPRLRKVSHLGFPWLFRRNRLMLWQQFVRLFEPHLRDTERLDPFYFNLLLDAAHRWEKQNPKRVICEAAHRLLRFEGRLHPPTHCYICEKPLGEEVALMTALLPTHPGCIYGPAIPRSQLQNYFETGKTTWLDDREIDYLYRLILKGL